MSAFAIRFLAAGLYTAALGACAQAPAASAPGPIGLRVRVATVNEWPDPEAFARRAAQAAGTPVRDPAGIAPRAFTLTLVCTGADECDRALARLAAATDLVSEAVADRRMSIPRPIKPGDPRVQ